MQPLSYRNAREGVVPQSSACQLPSACVHTQKMQKHTEEQVVEEQQPKRRKGSKTDLFGSGPSPNRRSAPVSVPALAAIPSITDALLR